MKDFDLRGKDYFTQEEAMHYAGIKAKDTFRREYGHLGFQAGSKLLYAKTDIKALIEASRLKQWQHSENAGSPTTSVGRKTARRSAAPSVQ